MRALAWCPQVMTSREVAPAPASDATATLLETTEITTRLLAVGMHRRHRAPTQTKNSTCWAAMRCGYHGQVTLAPTARVCPCSASCWCTTAAWCGICTVPASRCCGGQRSRGKARTPGRVQWLACRRSGRWAGGHSRVPCLPRPARRRARAGCWRSCRHRRALARHRHTVGACMLTAVGGSPHDAQRLLTAGTDGVVCLWHLPEEPPAAGAVAGSDGTGTGAGLGRGVVCRAEAEASHARERHARPRPVCHHCVAPTVARLSAIAAPQHEQLRMAATAAITAAANVALRVIAWSPVDPNLFAAAGHDGAVRVWDTRDACFPRVECCRTATASLDPGAGVGRHWRACAMRQ